ncbi:unnamed protein product [Phytomonas sp. Hart1]|nr:unnamed protein product [Phytomonas sp. Hart1]|eukprot:CCW70283.1 unnamed protein product [Phytomonas sp. isolate Hart1]
MLCRTVCKCFFGSFSSGFSKMFSGKGPGSGKGFFDNFTKSGDNKPGLFNFGLGGFGGGPFGDFIDKALEWCSRSHALDIARRNGIDLHDIRFEKTSEGGVRVMVDAPNASQLQIEELGRRVQEECPIARFRKTHIHTPEQQMKWLRLPDKYDR